MWVLEMGRVRYDKKVAAYSCITSGLKITVGQQTMSGQNGNVTGQNLTNWSCWPVFHTLILEKTAFASVNLGFVSLCKNTNRNLHKDTLTFLPNILPSQKWDLTKQNFFGQSSCPATIQKLFWALLHVNPHW